MNFFSTLKFTAATAALVVATSTFAADVKLKLAGQHPVDHNATRVLQETIDKITTANVGIKIKLFPAGQLGNGEVVFEDVAAGVIDIGHTFIYSHNDPVLEINSLPYLVSNYEEMEKIYSEGSRFYEVYEEHIAAQGIKLLGVFAEGFIGVGSTKKPTDAGGIGDKGLNIRVWSAEVGRLTSQAMGFNTTTMNWGDVVPAIQQGVIEGVIGGTAESNYTVMGDAVDYFTPYNAFVENTAFYINQNVWDDLTKEQQQVMSKAFSEAAAKSFALSKSVDQEYLGRLSEKDIEVVKISPEELAGIAKHVRETVWPALEKNLGKDLLDSIKADLD
jgi:TRAP-type C4-dicarboxylate transport system substrate-binding protein